MHPDDREDLADFTFELLQVMRKARVEHVDPDPGFLSVLDHTGIDRDDFLRSAKQVRDSGEKLELPRDMVHAYKHLMMPALVRIGVITE
jgi:hypothetical protein